MVLGRSNIVGMPMVCLLQSMNGTVTCCHSRTPNIPEIVRSVRKELFEEVIVEMPEICPAKDYCEEFAQHLAEMSSLVQFVYSVHRICEYPSL